MKTAEPKYAALISKISQLMEQARHSISQKNNTELLLTYWQVGKLIVQRERQENTDEKSSRQLILELSKELTLHVGKGFARSNLFAMRRFYQQYRFVQTVSGQINPERIQTTSGQPVIITKKTTKSLRKQSDIENLGKTISFQLSWSHYCELVKIDNNLERSFYQQQSINENWSVRELQRQKDTALFERISFSKDHKGVVTIAQKGHAPKLEIDIVKDPYVLEFLNISEKRHYTEKYLEQKIIDNLQSFILELGKGFTFVGRQFQLTVDTIH